VEDLESVAPHIPVFKITAVRTHRRWPLG
jgi:hypothetical protein